ncbi:hypothetical protein DFA_07072 [Cavenderia fasciculata]|uniref:CID domain-containing protein n=1 Tax=Cavenderia fasciculata TaxID=261658 RepID=F4PVE7_CACFS|nr:uncharacterized protein DFA_07072 [Cavenderia fasciculata]EGG19961.1 hypothetical protein DFA_07072 [Cavenderia fasciculata]|eukprot:XP_004366944.1 hypothetical protein DFA_07072 [Cavenderia fasciculata]
MICTQQQIKKTLKVPNTTNNIDTNNTHHSFDAVVVGGQVDNNNNNNNNHIMYQHPFGDLSSFDEFPTERFKEQLETLTTSKESIDKATQFVIDNLNSFSDLFDVLLNRMRKSAFSKRLSFFYLIDSICQRCSAKKNTLYKSIVGDSINEILPLILPDDNIELKQKNKVIIEKFPVQERTQSINQDAVIDVIVLVIWETKNIFEEALLSKANSILAGTFKESSRLICPHLSEKEYVRLFKKMEDDRREQKKKKYEASIGQGHPLDDFIDFWCRICVAVGVPLQIQPDESDYSLYQSLKQTFLLPEWTIEQIEELPKHYQLMFDYQQQQLQQNNNMNNMNNNNDINNSSMDQSMDYDPQQYNNHFQNNNNNNNNNVDMNNNNNNNMNMMMNIDNNNNNNNGYSFDQYTIQQQLEHLQNSQEPLDPERLQLQQQLQLLLQQQLQQQKQMQLQMQLQQQMQQQSQPFTFIKSKNSKPYNPVHTTDYNLIKQYFGEKQKSWEEWG